jgi:hypothetical protein
VVFGAAPPAGGTAEDPCPKAGVAAAAANITGKTTLRSCTFMISSEFMSILYAAKRARRNRVFYFDPEAGIGVIL